MMNTVKRLRSYHIPISSGLGIGLKPFIFFIYSAVIWSAKGAVFPVTNNLDSGPGSLRQAIEDANNAPDMDTIDLTQISGSIVLNSTLHLNTHMKIQGPGANHLAIDGDHNNDGAPDVQLMFVSFGAEATLSGLTLRNGAETNGGGLFNFGTTVINACAFTGNQAFGNGGGIYNQGGLTLLNSTLNQNTAFSGGGIHNELEGSITIINSTLSGNAVELDGAGISNSDQLTLLNSTITGNTAGQSGGGIFNTGTITIRNSIAAGNQAPNNPEVSGTIHLQSNNILSIPAGSTIQDILNPTLSNHGGPTSVHALVVDSPAIAAGDNGFLPADTHDLDGDNNFAESIPFDQRGTGFPRIQGNILDIGAFEHEAAEPAIPEVRILATDAIAGEHLGQVDQGQFQIIRDSGAGTLSVTLQIGANSTASNADHQVTNSITLDFVDGETSKNVPLIPVDDSIAEPAETVLLELLASPNYDIHPNQNTATVTITANDFGVRHLDDNGQGSLRQAILNANQLGGNPTIDLTQLTGTVQLQSTLNIDGSMAIRGPGSDQLAIDGDHNNDGTPDVQLMIIANGAEATLSGLTLRNGIETRGGGLLNLGSTTITKSTITGNQATGDGGGVHNKGGLTISDSTIHQNTADSGGGLHNDPGGSLTIINSTISGNTANGDGAGVSNADQLTVLTSTITGNTAGQHGGGLFNTGTLTIRNSIAAGNQAPNDAEVSGNIDQQTHNILSISAGSTIQDILNPTLSNHGGPTSVHALVADSPAIDAGDNGFLPADTQDLDDDDNIAESIPFDQRGTGFPRIQGAQVDIGAFEHEAAPVVPPGTPQISITAPDPLSGEHLGFIDRGLFRVTRNTSTGNLTVSLSIDASSTASSSDHQISQAFDVTFANGSSTVDIPLVPSDDNVAEPEETVRLNLVPSPNYVILPNQHSASVLIEANDFGVRNLNDDGQGSLRQAIQNANQLGGAVIIDLSHLSGKITLQSELNITGNISIKGPITGTGITLSGDKNLNGHADVRVLRVENSGIVHLINVTISKGFGGTGGGVFNLGNLTLIGVTLQDNLGQLGGAIMNFGSLRLQNCTLSGNDAWLQGGALMNVGGTTLIQQCTITGNQSNNKTGGIFALSGTVTIQNSIVAGNTDSVSVLVGVDIDGSTINTENSLIGIPGTKTIQDILNPALSNNGGTTLTHALASGSPAINGGKNTLIPKDTLDLDGDGNTSEALPFDQRGAGYPRSSGSVVDMGALESNIIVALTAIDSIAGEHRGVIDTATFRVTRSVSSGGMNVHLKQNPSSTASPSDHNIQGLFFVSMLDGESSVDIVLTPLDDSIAEPDETVQLELIPSTDYQIAANQTPVTATIAANDFGVDRTLDAGEGTLRQAILNANHLGGNPSIDLFGLSGTIPLQSTLEIHNNLSILGPRLVDLIVSGDRNKDGTANPGDIRCLHIHPGAQVYLDHLTISKGYADHGGGIRNAGNLTLLNTIIEQNAAIDTGGGILNDTGASLLIQNSTFHRNTVRLDGGGVLNHGNLIVQNSTFSANNTTTSNGGGISSHGNLTIQNSTFTANTAIKLGGGIHQTGPSFLLQNTIVAGNRASSQEEISGTISSGSHNMTGIPSGQLIHQILDPVLRHIGNPTPTHALVPGSQAINQGDASLIPLDTLDLDGDGDRTEVLPFDQRGKGFQRVADGGLDIGAVEFTPTISITAFDALASEHLGMIDTGTYRVQRDDAVGQLDVSLEINAGSTASSADHNLLHTLKISFADGVGHVDITLTPVDDTVSEADETVQLDLLPMTGYRLDPSNASAMVTISANDFGVTNTNDSGEGSFRQAILNANLLGGNPTIDLSHLHGSTIHLQSSIDLQKNMTIVGGSSLSISGDKNQNLKSDISDVRPFIIHQNCNVTMQSLIIRDGYSSSSGGGIYNAGNLTLELCHLVNNEAISGGAIANIGALKAVKSDLTGNRATTGNGGAILNEGSLIVSHSLISANRSTNRGGAIETTKDMEMSHSTLSGNRTDGLGGAVSSKSIRVQFYNCTIVKNVAKKDAGAAYIDDGSIEFYNSIVIGNQSPLVTNVLLTQGAITILDSLFDIPTGSTLNDIIHPDLADNGGPTKTHALVVGSPAINAGNSKWISADRFDLDGDNDFKEPVPFDQRGQGFSRVRDGKIDVGAVEFIPTISIVAEIAQAGEHLGTVKTGTFRVQRYSLDRALDVELMLNPRSTASASDHSLKSRFKVNFQPGVSVAYVALKPIDDSIAEPDEYVQLDLVPGPDYLINPQEASARVTIAANDFGVTHTKDSGEGSLRQAIQNVNDLGGNPTIDLSNLTGTIQLQSTLTLKKDVTIKGGRPGQVIISGDKNKNNITDAGDLPIMRIDKGRVVLSQLSLKHGYSKQQGGAVDNSGHLTLNKCVVSENTSESYGGGLASGGALTILHSTIQHNIAVSLGGGVYNSGTLNVINSTIYNNTTQDQGGGLAADLSSFTFIMNSTISGNKAAVNGGGIFNDMATLLTIYSSTITGNSVNLADGGGIFISNSTGTALYNSLVLNNKAKTNQDISGFVSFSKDSLIGIPKGYKTIDILNPTLADNGGPTWTHALVKGSPAMDQGDNRFIPNDAFDLDGDGDTHEPLPFGQRGVGFSRVAGAKTDIGAYETHTVISITAIDSIAGEHLGVIDPATFRVSRDSSAGAMNVVLRINKSSTASASDHSLGGSFFISFLDGVSSKDITLTPVDDSIAEPDEFVQLDLVPTPGYNIDTNKSSAKATITANDFGVSNTFDAGEASLRQAILNANKLGGNPTIDLSGIFGIIPLQSTLEINSSLSIVRKDTRPLVISGDRNPNGFADPQDIRIFEINAGSNVHFSGLNLVKGYADDGACIRNAGNLVVRDTYIGDGTALNKGGAIYNELASNLTLLNSTIARNASRLEGAGVYNAGTLMTQNSTLSGNHARSSRGGGIYNSGTATIQNNTITLNTASTVGGGIINSGGNIILNNNVIAGNWAPTDPEISGTVPSPGQNLIGIPGLNPLSSVLNTTLTDNGGPTLTHALSAMSPAINKGDVKLLPRDTFDIDGDGDVSENLPWDQRGRGFLRVAAGGLDYGAVEFTPTVSIVAADPTAGEHLTSVDNAIYTISRDNVTGPLEVSIVINTLSTASSTDHSLSSQFKVTIPDGMHSVDVTLVPVNDSIAEADETVQLDIEPLPHYKINRNRESATATIAANDFGVNSNDDSGEGTLRQAILNANQLGGNPVIDIKSLPAQNIILKSNVSIKADLTIVGGDLNRFPMSISGDTNGNDKTDAGDSQVLHIQKGSKVTLDHLRIHGGYSNQLGGGILNEGDLTLKNSFVVRCKAKEGGGIYNTGTMTAENVDILNNSAESGGGISNEGQFHAKATSLFENLATVGNGGGMLNKSKGVFASEFFRFLDNESAMDGAGYSNQGMASFKYLISHGNKSKRNGGSIHNAGRLTIIQSSLYDNTAKNAGGSIFSETDLKLINTTLSGNSTDGNGGGIRLTGGDLIVENCTIVKNTSKGQGGGIHLSNAHVIIYNSIVIGNPSSSGANIYLTLGSLSPSGLMASIPTGKSLKDIIDPTLRHNGGAVLNHALVKGSPAIDAGDNSKLSMDAFDLDGDGNLTEMIPLDQRGIGYIRVAGGKVDLGAYEWQIESVSPSAANKTFTMEEDTLAQIILDGSVPDGKTPIAQVVTLPEKGTLYQTSDGITLGEPISDVPTLVSDASNRVIYRPPHDGEGQDYAQFQYAISDGINDSLPAVVNIHISPVNDSPRLTPIPDYQTDTRDAIQIPLTLSDPDHRVEDLVLKVGTSHEALLPSENLSIQGSGAERSLHISSAEGRTGFVEVWIQITDPEGATHEERFQIQYFNPEQGSPAPVSIRSANSNEDEKPTLILSWLGKKIIKVASGLMGEYTILENAQSPLVIDPQVGPQFFIISDPNE